MNPNSELRKSRLYRVLAFFGLILVVPLFVPLLLIVALSYALVSSCLYFAIWLAWLPRGRYILFVYSDSPVWHDYIEEHILPAIRDRAVILNWSQRRSRSWRRSLAVAAFKHFGGWREFIPMGIVFRPFRRAKVFRFFQPFRDYKHGKPNRLVSVQKEFLDCSRLPRGKGPPCAVRKNQRETSCKNAA